MVVIDAQTLGRPAGFASVVGGHDAAVGAFLPRLDLATAAVVLQPVCGVAAPRELAARFLRLAASTGLGRRIGVGIALGVGGYAALAVGVALRLLALPASVTETVAAALAFSERAEWPDVAAAAPFEPLLGKGALFGVAEDADNVSARPDA